MSAVAATPFSFKDFLKSFMLWELAKGMARHVLARMGKGA